jgi:hypothetical protein
VTGREDEEREIELRFWLSGPLVLNGLVRPGISIGPEDVRQRLPSWRRNEYCQALKAFAAKHGKPITDAEANYRIDKALALGELDAAGPVLRMTGNREEIVEAVMYTSEQYGIPVDRAKAERLTDRAIPSRPPWPAIIFAAVCYLLTAFILIAA